MTSRKFKISKKKSAGSPLGWCGVKELNAKYKAELAAQKARARDSQMTRREQELDDRRTQTAALVTALNAVVRVIERLEPKSEKNEREKEGIYSIATSNDVL